MKDTTITWPFRRTVVIVSTFVLMFVAGTVAVGITHQTIWFLRDFELQGSSIRVVAAQTEAGNNLKSMAFALHDYAMDHNDRLPSALNDSQGRALHGWTLVVQPYLENQSLFDKTDKTKPWSHPANSPVYQTKCRWFINPLEETRFNAKGLALTHYAGNVHVLGRSTPLTLKYIVEQDGLSNTLLIGEVAGRFKPWGYPYNWRDPALGINRTLNGFGNAHRNGAQFVMGDGSVRFISEKTSLKVLKALATPDGSETIEGEW